MAKKTKRWKARRHQKHREKERLRKQSKPEMPKPEKSTLWKLVIHPWDKDKEK